MIRSIHNKIINNEVNKYDLYNDYLNKAREIDKDCNLFVTILDSYQNDDKDNILSGIPYVLKDNFSTKDILTTGGSNTLKDFIPIYNSTVYQKLVDKGALLIGKSTLDEFGMGATGLTCFNGITLNPLDKRRICGGSSSGSAASVAAGIAPFSIGSDTGDSVRKPASYLGIVGFKPTYGLISRYGLFAFASSLDHVGVFATSTLDAAIVTNEIKGKDIHDMTTYDSSNIDLVSDVEVNNDKKLFYIKELVDKNNYEYNKELYYILDEFNNLINKLKEEGYHVEGVSFDKNILNSITSVYQCISCAEATSNMSNLTGISFGVRENKDNINDLIKQHRTNGFSPLIKRRFIIGSYVLQKENQEKYFKNAQRVRGIIVKEFKKLFKEYGGFITPASPQIAPFIKDVNDKLEYNELTTLNNILVIGNFGGFPSITIPMCKYDDMPVGVNITYDNYLDKELLQMSYECEKIINYRKDREDEI